MQQGIKALAIEREQMAQIKQRAQIFPFFDLDVQNQTAQKIARRGREMRARPGFVNDQGFRDQGCIIDRQVRSRVNHRDRIP